MYRNPIRTAIHRAIMYADSIVYENPIIPEVQHEDVNEPHPEDSNTSEYGSILEHDSTSEDNDNIDSDMENDNVENQF